MPSGITSDIYYGKDVTVQQYMEGVARSMTDFIHMRDSGAGKLTKRKVSDYHSKKRAEIKAELEEWRMLGAKEQRAFYEKEMEGIEQRAMDSIKKNIVLRGRYEAMIADVCALKVPAEIAYAREYGIKYLEDSIKFDCNTEYFENLIKKKRDSFEEWNVQHLRSLRKEIDYHHNQYLEEEERVRSFNANIDKWSALVGYEIV